MNGAFHDNSPSPATVDTDPEDNRILVTFQTMDGEEHTFRLCPATAAKLAWDLFDYVTPEVKA